MKALILFDGSSSSFTCIKAACEDATFLYQSQCSQASSLEPAEALLLMVQVSGDYHLFAPKPCAQPDLVRSLLEQGVRKLECSGEFDEVAAEIIVCEASNLTEVIQDRAREWKATAIYLPLDPATSPNITPRIGWWQHFGLKRRESRVEPAIFKPQTPLTTAQVRAKQLLENSCCKVVVVDNAGVPMKLSYYPPTARVPTAQHILKVKGEVGFVA